MTSCICAISQSLDGAVQQVPVVQAGVRIVNQNAMKKQNPPKRVWLLMN
ncbi:hypothetical protein SF148580_3080 [Shigella flexneri 1485-80]|nr:hypothetical protein SF148580_3080 [Shigella flexneri 1485-80]